MALICGWLLASQITKKSATASGILRKSNETMFSPFFFLDCPNDGLVDFRCFGKPGWSFFPCC